MGSEFCLQAEIQQEGSLSLLILQGDLGNPYHLELDSAFRAAMVPPCTALLVDLQQVSHIASFALAAIGFNFKVLNDSGGMLAIVVQADHQLKPFRLAGLDQILPVFFSREEARKALRFQLEE